MIGDIYFEREYAELNMKKDEKIEIFNFECEYGKVRYLFIKRKIKLLEKEYFDIITPYGYGGPVLYNYEKDNLKKLVIKFRKKFSEYCQKNMIISEFIRFHPLIKNNEYSDEDMEIIYLSDTIYMNLENEEILLKEMDGKARNMVRKSIKNNVIIKEEIDEKSIKEFIKMYYETMNKNLASEEYFFSEEYFKKLFTLGPKKVKLFNAYYEGRVISSSSILLGEGFIHYHLSANTSDGYKLAANNLLLFEVAKWGIKNGYSKFHLGGGYGGNGSPLFKFKRAMAKNNLSKFYIGKKVHDEATYNLLIKKNEEIKPEIKGKNENFFPLYRR